MIIELNVNTIAAGVIISFVSLLGGILIKTIRSVDKLTNTLGTLQPPDGVFGRVVKVELELSEMRDWLIRNGYERRTGKSPTVP